MLGTTPQQRTIEAPLAELPARVREAGLGAPAVIVVGEVVRLRAELAWFESLPLFGARVLVTRAADQAGRRCSRALRAAGAEARAVPMHAHRAGRRSRRGRAHAGRARRLRRGPLRERERGARAGAPRGARSAFRSRDAAARIVCVGPATARAALGGRPARRFGPARSGSTPTGSSPRSARILPVAGGRFLLPRAAAGGRERLADLLTAARRARRDADRCTAAVPPDLDPAPLREALAAGEFDTLHLREPVGGAALRGAPRRGVARRRGPLYGGARSARSPRRRSRGEPSPRRDGGARRGPGAGAGAGRPPGEEGGGPMSFPIDPARAACGAPRRCAGMARETRLSRDDLVLPLFAVEGRGVREPIGSMPGVFRWSIGPARRRGQADRRPRHSGRHPLRRAGGEGRARLGRGRRGRHRAARRRRRAERRARARRHHRRLPLRVHRSRSLRRRRTARRS